eukprot:scaffold106810_cov57-Attheya_sp.AAC.2
MGTSITIMRLGLSAIFVARITTILLLSKYCHSFSPIALPRPVGQGSRPEGTFSFGTTTTTAVTPTTTRHGFACRSQWGGGTDSFHHGRSSTIRSNSEVTTLLTSTASNNIYTQGDGDDNGGVYRPFAEYAWTKLQQSGLLDSERNNLVPVDLASNTSPAKGMPEGCTVQVAVKGSYGNTNNEGSTIRYGRYALLETLDKDGKCVDQGIHVLNLVVFPSVANQSNMPVLGMDLVTLPGSKHLIAMDFQPTGSLSGQLSLPTDVEERFKELHQKHTASGALPWGGEIPEPAQRYFSPYAIWTRLKGPLDVIEQNVYPAFCDYVDLYIEYASSYSCASSGDDATNDDDQQDKDGQASYLNYRRTNDPARPMLKRLYGEEWTERLIETVLFKDI